MPMQRTHYIFNVFVSFSFSRQKWHQNTSKCVFKTKARKKEAHTHRFTKLSAHRVLFVRSCEIEWWKKIDR